MMLNIIYKAFPITISKLHYPISANFILSSTNHQEHHTTVKMIALRSILLLALASVMTTYAAPLAQDGNPGLEIVDGPLVLGPVTVTPTLPEEDDLQEPVASAAPSSAPAQQPTPSQPDEEANDEEGSASSSWNPFAGWMSSGNWGRGDE
jgi:hypothetical protein